MIRTILQGISDWAIPVLLVGIPLVGLIRGVKVYDVFIEGAKEGFQVAIRIIPFLVGILVAIGMFRASGAMDMMTNAIRPLLSRTIFPPELFPLAVLRPLSGSGSLALTTDLIKRYGADSMLSRMAATLYGSSETLFYVLAVYFGAVGVKRTRHAIPSALVGDTVAALVAAAVCLWMFR
ncbi:MAG TPA: nucleoside recognition domain-containing protein [Thermoanaerobaculia bacterium]|jgi:spore maturation protein B|nr:nucleoside recognition domain-containing protein [Thermoanaerobaculia bacterium]